MSSSLAYENMRKAEAREERYERVRQMVARMRDEYGADLPEPEYGEGYAVWIVEREPLPERVILRVSGSGKLTLEGERAFVQDFDYLPWLARDLERYLTDPYAHLTTGLAYHEGGEEGHARNVAAYHERQERTCDLLGEEYCRVTQAE